jgi:transglutaminase-like putative cysteine protease
MRMKLKIDLSMEYMIQFSDPVLLAIAPVWAENQTVIQSDLSVENASLHWIDDAGGVGQRVWVVTASERLRLRLCALVDIHRRAVPWHGLEMDSWDTLPPDVLPYLRPSRFCQSDMFASFVGSEFGHLRGGEKMEAIVAWAAAALSYVPGSSNAGTTAIDTFLTRQGVCRDYAHIVCTLARAAGIPARYTTGYGVNVSPPDFHAVAEVWLGQAWHIADATGMSTASDLAIIGTGRDAGDIPFMETAQPATPVYQDVHVARVL